MLAVHFGAGNIGRGFVGTLLHEGGYEVVFSDVAAPLVDALSEARSYTVHEVGAGGVDREVTNFRALNSTEDPQAVAAEVASADVVTTAVGPAILKFIAPHVLSGLLQRPAEAQPLQIMACENALGATDTLRDHVQELAGEQWEMLSARAVFANTAVDRIVPGQPVDGGVDVTVEPFYEWAIEAGPFGEDRPNIPGAHFVDDLGPYIERKLFTVNTGHAATAYLGFRAGRSTIAEALTDETVFAGVRAALEETSALLVDKHGFAPEEMAAYRATILERFRNPELPDTVDRVGRQPLRKLSRHERLIGPAVEAAERGLSVEGLLAVVEAALHFESAADEQTRQLQKLLTELDADALTTQITGLQPADPLYSRVRELVTARQG
ncbi:mannitol-1-phosphate 5-dehydrogenase [Nesterenkonia sp. LB17]|uniref:mannitol-1-phosphate 5-dehydrogenase n=1 Tax=unclassified Nesterenkonia TaxID=2629769 RepID=UPI001F4C5D35|nr:MULTISPECIES: mannitol-1-phosphate 5-dehydrogenase [unclassified Nesterenkonia]MCH8560471.1 mannitol-1-phosphate 5-dehydrogenase [Nesterenkonia sp. DZ6]MCH8562738.1 mannitol-1-phosphate 5-dehydrogenase [Nesterenkonia sp. YGD6]MCH8565787.1 mannitol-1-phosphate 5-dehydrogenase [Nesterenkonia sp. LB17]